MKKRIPLHLTTYNGSGTYTENRIPTLCDYLLHQYFSFPEDTPAITITLSTKETENSYKVKIPVGSNSMRIHHDGDWNYTTMFLAAKTHVKNLSEKWEVESLFVTLEY